MSHYAMLTVNFQQRHEQQLIGSLKKMFGEEEVEVHNDPVPLKDYFGKDATKNSKEEGTFAEACHIIVRRKALEKYAGRTLGTNDAGYMRTKNGGYTAFIDSAGVTEEQTGLIAQEYALLVAEKQLRAKGWNQQQMRRVELPDNSIMLEARTLR
jgi:hypothetical protein